MEFAANIKASQADQNAAKQVDLDQIDVYRRQYNHLLSGSSSIGSYERSFFHTNISILFPSIPSSSLRLTVAQTTSGEVSRTPGTPPTLLFYAVLFAIPGAASINVPAPFKAADAQPVSDDLPESPVRHVLKVGPAVAYVPTSSPETAATSKSENKKFLSSMSYSKQSHIDPLKDAKEKALQLFVDKIETEVHSLTIDLGGVVVPWEGNRALISQRGQEGMRSSVSIASSKGSGWFKK